MVGHVGTGPPKLCDVATAVKQMVASGRYTDEVIANGAGRLASSARHQIKLDNEALTGQVNAVLSAVGMALVPSMPDVALRLLRALGGESDEVLEVHVLYNR